MAGKRKSGRRTKSLKPDTKRTARPPSEERANDPKQNAAPRDLLKCKVSRRRRGLHNVVPGLMK
jgi:hypothetical protein